MDGKRGPRFARALCFAAAAACSGPVHHLVPGSDPGWPRIRFLDGSISANDRCPVSGSALNPRMDALHVNGRSIGFC
jgi:hypothetical protein